ncbi:UNKNOWN [Stylonychia lemnae]|uniref:LNS2/PITP domain-containing protein n=1 Tax=Stylonychia lemnae TaxID=5949 RepID=A0A078AH16_STYLE|nr:UNKNOWN [Stylonychia lemnae]|eukprot:CDW81529.1 UNKNOWN [Stylonychia lemnae]
MVSMIEDQNFKSEMQKAPPKLIPNNQMDNMIDQKQVRTQRSRTFKSKNNLEEEKVDYDFLKQSPETIQKTIEREIQNEIQGNKKINFNEIYCKKPFEPLDFKPAQDDVDPISDDNCSGSDCDVPDEEKKSTIFEIKQFQRTKSLSLKEELQNDKYQSRSKTKYQKSIYPTKDQLETLDLKQGCNDIIYSVQSRIQGRQILRGRIFLWNYDTKIIISDVDGTITKSDLLGHLLPRFGRDWSHPGIAKLFNDIKSNGYEFLYLTARPIGMADTTRDYIKGISQEKLSLPDGPVIMSPDRAMKSLKREVIFRKPYHETNPFHGGFGNRETDAISYRAVDIDLRNIFIINPQGEIHHFDSLYKKTQNLQSIQFNDRYQLLAELVHQMFPRIQDNDAGLLADQDYENLASAKIDGSKKNQIKEGDDSQNIQQKKFENLETFELDSNNCEI